jgi:hypothetical protein
LCTLCRKEGLTFIRLNFALTMQAVTGAPPAPVLDIGLNPQQLHAVTRGPGAVIVLAGPGNPQLALGRLVYHNEVFPPQAVARLVSSSTVPCFYTTVTTFPRVISQL